ERQIGDSFVLREGPERADSALHEHNAAIREHRVISAGSENVGNRCDPTGDVAHAVIAAVERIEIRRCIRGLAGTQYGLELAPDELVQLAHRYKGIDHCVMTLQTRPSVNGRRG